jgi:hypothetical protein
MCYTTSQPASNTGYLQRKRHHLRVDFVRPSTQTTSMLLRHMLNFLITLHWIFASMLVRPGGVHSTSHGLTLCTCKLSVSGRDAVMMLSS